MLKTTELRTDPFVRKMSRPFTWHPMPDERRWVRTEQLDLRSSGTYYEYPESLTMFFATRLGDLRRLDGVYAQTTS